MNPVNIWALFNQQAHAATKPPTVIPSFLARNEAPIQEATQPQPTALPPMPTPVESHGGMNLSGFMGPRSKSPEEIEMEKVYRQGLDKQAQIAKGYEDQLAQMGEKPSGVQTMDLSPLAGLVDSWTGSNLTQAYKAPTAGKEWEAKKAMLQEAAQKAQGQMTDDQLAFLKMKADQANQHNNAKLLGIMSRRQNFEDSQDVKMFNTVNTELGKINELYQQDLQGLDTIESALASGDLAMIQSVLSQFARRVGGEKGALSDGDVARAMPGDMVNSIGGLQRWLGGQGPASPAVIDRMQKLVAIARGNANEYMQKRLTMAKQKYSVGPYAAKMGQGQWGDNMFNTFNSGLDKGGQTQAPPQPGVGQAPKKVMSPAEFFAQGK